MSQALKLRHILMRSFQGSPKIAEHSEERQQLTFHVKQSTSIEKGQSHLLQFNYDKNLIREEDLRMGLVTLAWSDGHSYHRIDLDHLMAIDASEGEIIVSISDCEEN